MTDLALAPVTGTAGGPRLRHAAAGEWRKLVSLRSTYWTVAVAVVGSILVTVLVTSTMGHHTPRWYQTFDPTNQSLSGLFLAILAIGVLGGLTMSGEYGSGTIRSSLAAVPDRRLLLAAKAVVVGAVCLVVGEVIAFACFGVGQVILRGDGAPTAALSQPGVARAVLLSGAFLALVGLSALALGAMVRHTAGVLASYVGITYMLSLVFSKLGGHAVNYTPVFLLQNSVSATVHQATQVNAGVAFGLMALYTVVLTGVGGILLVRRDA